jgi:hypothetical protein
VPVYYQDGFAEEGGQKAKRLIEARDAYIAAWLEWNDGPLAGLNSAEDECEIMRHIFEQAMKERETEKSE